MYRSKFESRFANLLNSNEVKFHYEQDKVKYILENKYNPDFKLGPNFYLETKGLFTSADRRKMKAVIEQNPNITFVMIFQDPNKKISKSSKTSYASWCDKNGIEWGTTEDLCDIIKKHSDKLYS